MIQLTVSPGSRIIELGGGDCPNPASTINVDVRPGEKVHFTVDFESENWPIQTEEWDAVFSQYCLEHVSWRCVSNFLKETLRIIKPGAKAVFVIPNTEAQLQWIQKNPAGWDGKGIFDSASCVLFGDQDYPANAHKSYFSPVIVHDLFQKAGFERVITRPYGERGTDMVVEAVKPVNPEIVLEAKKRTVEFPPIAPEQESIVQGPRKPFPQIVPGDDPLNGGELKVENSRKLSPTQQLMQTTEGRQKVFNKDYFNGGAKHGGYAREGMWDFPVHEITARHILHRKPESVLEIGCARGYILKRLQDAGVLAKGIEISKHCFMTRAAGSILNADFCTLKEWGGEKHADLCFSIATLEHVPEEHIPDVIREMARTCKRGLHGIDFGERDDGFDKTHCTLKPRIWWQEAFNTYAPDWPVEVLDKEELEQGVFKWADGQMRLMPEDYFGGDGKLKLNLGCYTVQYHNGWVNIDIEDVAAFSQHYGFNFRRHDVRNGLPYGTGVVDLIHCSHMLEHLTWKEGLTFLRECRRVIRPNGIMRIAVPDAGLLLRSYGRDSCWDTQVNDNHFQAPPSLSEFDEINDGCASAPTAAGKLWALLHEGHKNILDQESLSHLLQEAGWEPIPVQFRETKCGEEGKQLLRESLDMFPCLSLFTEARPKLS